MTPYTLDELISESAEGLQRLRTLNRLGHPKPRVCHHFFPLDGAVTDAYLPELPERIRAIGGEPVGIDVIGDPVGIEVWFRREPDPAWLDPLIEAYHLAATECSAVYAGWSYEPDRTDEPSPTDTIH